LGIFAPQDFSGYPEAQNWLDQAEGQTFVKGEFSDVFFYRPTLNQEGWTNGQPQEFLGATPEPSSMTLFGTGMLGFAGMLRRKLRA